MITRKLNEIAYLAGGKVSDPAYDGVVVKGVSTDSRSIGIGNLFVPLIGERFDGHQYVENALHMGASASFWQYDHGTPPEGLPVVLVEDTLVALQQLAREYRNRLQVRVIGITGSNGKTTTKDMIASILETTYKVHKTAGNLNNHIGLPLTLLQMDETTEMAVIEMGMSGLGEISLLSKLASPEVAVITNIGEAHLQQLGSREQIAKAKLEIVDGLKKDGLLVFNGDEPLLTNEIKSMHTLKKFQFGMKAHNDYYPFTIMLDQESQGCYFTLKAADQPDDKLTYFIPMMGYHNVTNALSAIAVSKFMGVSSQDVEAGLKQMKATGMRIEVIPTNSGLTLLNDAYNASPSSMKAAIELLGQMKCKGKKMIILGDMLELGEDEVAYHKEIGQILTPQNADYVFTFGNLAKWIAKEAKPLHPRARVYSFKTKDELINKVVSIASKDDIILVKASRGMKFEEIVEALKMV